MFVQMISNWFKMMNFKDKYFCVGTRDKFADHGIIEIIEIIEILWNCEMEFSGGGWGSIWFPFVFQEELI